MSADRNMVLRVARTCCGSQPGGCGSATYLCSDVCGMLLTSNRVYTAYELGFATWDRGSYSSDVMTMLRVRNRGVAGRNLCRQKLFVGFSEPYLKGTRPEQFLIPFYSSLTLTLSLWSLSHVLRTTKRV